MKATKQQRRNAEKHAFFKTGKPIRPLSAYNTFFQHEKEKHDIVKLRGKERLTVVAARWKNLDPTVRCLYEEEARVQNVKYKQALASWKNRQSQGQERSTYSQHHHGWPDPSMFRSVMVYPQNFCSFPSETKSAFNIPQVFSSNEKKNPYLEPEELNLIEDDLEPLRVLSPQNDSVLSVDACDHLISLSKSTKKISRENVKSHFSGKDTVVSFGASCQAEFCINSTICEVEQSMDKDFLDFVADVFSFDDCSNEL